MIPIVILSIVLVAAGFFLFSVRLLFVKNGEFKGTCANNNPYLQNSGATCGVCGRTAGEACAEEK
ncbi:hypothetical protein [Arundinibacter roseus]|uniref:Membrane or secreted protein n=1 Tax=Arundinibacter roseus TaxID=2070510 RepID=A0A4V2X9K3_9BACT|nr:hypothetical protein [Arundinibacter roseus]TDB64165.1 hypothetical protein EZE20_14605 [Arundinibacter roseus]